MLSRVPVSSTQGESSSSYWGSEDVSEPPMLAQLGRGRTGSQTPDCTLLLSARTLLVDGLTDNVLTAKTSGKKRRLADTSPGFESRF